MPFKKIKSKTDDQDHWDKITSSGPEKCCICDRKSKKVGKLTYWIKHKKTGEDLYKCSNCETLGSNWLKKFQGPASNCLKEIFRKEN
jgi:hypothetical protein